MIVEVILASAQRQVMTVGHSNHAPQEFLMLLVRHGVTAVGDVRSSPYSQHVPHFNREPLKSLLNTVGIEYAFLGNELGGRPTDPALYDAQQRVRYDGIAATDIFRHGIERVLRGADRFLIALLCSEGEPLNCHRTLLVGEALAKRGVGVEHILTNGGLETHDHAMSRLLEIHK